MRILLASDSFDPAVGGVQRVVRDLAETLIEGGHEPVVLAPWAAGLEAAEEIGGVHVVRVRLGRPAVGARALLGFAARLPSARAHVAGLLRAFRPDVAHLHFLQSPLAYLVPRACRRAGVPLVVTAHGRDVVGPMVEDDPFGRRAVARTLAAASVVTAPSNATLSDARRWVPGRPRGIWQAVPNALPADMEGWLDRPAAQGTGVVAVGELHPKKGFDVLIRAVARLPNVVLRIAGEGAQRGELEALVDELGVGDRVALLGFVGRRDLPDLLRESAVQCVPSRREPFGLVILEAFACSVPVVASNVDGIPEVCGPEGPALLVAPDDPDGLATALSRVISETALRGRMIAAGRVRASQLTRARHAERTMDLYLRAIHGDGRAG